MFIYTAEMIVIISRFRTWSNGVQNTSSLIKITSNCYIEEVTFAEFLNWEICIVVKNKKKMYFQFVSIQRKNAQYKSNEMKWNKMKFHLISFHTLLRCNLMKQTRINRLRLKRYSGIMSSILSASPMQKARSSNGFWLIAFVTDQIILMKFIVRHVWCEYCVFLLSVNNITAFEHFSKGVWIENDVFVIPCNENLKLFRVNICLWKVLGSFIRLLTDRHIIIFTLNNVLHLTSSCSCLQNLTSSLSWSNVRFMTGCLTVSDFSQRSVIWRGFTYLTHRWNVNVSRFLCNDIHSLFCATPGIR